MSFHGKIESYLTAVNVDALEKKKPTVKHSERLVRAPTMKPSLRQVISLKMSGDGRVDVASSSSGLSESLQSESDLSVKSNQSEQGEMKENSKNTSGHVEGSILGKR